MKNNNRFERVDFFQKMMKYHHIIINDTQTGYYSVVSALINLTLIIQEFDLYFKVNGVSAKKVKRYVSYQV